MLWSMYLEEAANGFLLLPLNPVNEKNIKVNIILEKFLFDTLIVKAIKMKQKTDILHALDSLETILKKEHTDEETD